MRLQRELVAAAEAEGVMQVGWKAGFGAPAARERFGLDAPLVGALLDRTRLDTEAVVSISGWKEARAEAELAMLIGEDLAGDVTPEHALARVAGLAPAIELVDLHPVPDSPAEALAGNIFHRHWMTGAFDEPPRDMDLSGLIAVVDAMETDLTQVGDVEALTGRAGDVIAEVARIAARHSRGLLRGDVVILGSVVPPTPVAPGEGFRFTLSGYPPIEAVLTD